MNTIQRIFNQQRVLLPVVHPVSEEIAGKSIDTAVSAGCKGIFLIDQGLSTKEVLQLAVSTKQRYPNLWVGLNLLEMDLPEVYRRVEDSGLDGVWSDCTDTTVLGIDGLPDHRPGGKIPLFGGVAFKYQRPVADAYLERAAEIASMFVDVVTTSGPGTGIPAPVDKVRRMKRGLRDKALGLASGVTLDNVTNYLPHVSAFLVGTGVETSFGVLDFEKVNALRLEIESYHTPAIKKRTYR
jgi:hypothetical protein